MDEDEEGQESQEDQDQDESSQADTTGSQAESHSQQQTQKPNTDDDDEKPISRKDARELRRENQGLRKRRTELENRLRTHEEAGLSELEKYKKQVKELQAAQAEADRRDRERAVETLLAGAQYPDLLLAKVDLAEIEFDDRGKIKGGERLVSRLRDQYPALWSAGSADGGSGGSGTTGKNFDMNRHIRNMAGRG